LVDDKAIVKPLGNVTVTAMQRLCDSPPP